MGLAEFARLVARMRAAQRGFFRASPGTAAKEKYFQESKDLERRADNAIHEVLEQPTLFESEG